MTETAICMFIIRNDSNRTCMANYGNGILYFCNRYRCKSVSYGNGNTDRNLLIALLLIGYKFIYRPDDINEINPENAMSLRGTIPEAI